MSERITVTISKEEAKEIAWLLSNCTIDRTKFTPIPLKETRDRFNEIKSSFFLFFCNLLGKNPEDRLF